MDLHDLDVRINKAGVALSAASDALGALGLSETAAAPIVAALEAVDDAQRDIQQWSTTAQRVLPAGSGGTGSDLPPGMVVVDVGGADDGVYTGPINAAGLTDGNKAYIANHLGDFSNKYGQAFDGKITFPAVMGDLANTPEDPLTPDGFDLSAPLPSH